jgi:hypothetical protein
MNATVETSRPPALPERVWIELADGMLRGPRGETITPEAFKLVSACLLRRHSSRQRARCEETLNAVFGQSGFRLARHLRLGSVQGDGTVRGPRGEQVPREEFEALGPSGGTFRMILSEVDARLWQIADAPESALLGTDAELAAVTISRDAEQPLPDARRTVSGRAQG